ncbi:MAG: hypothetical protein JNL70_28040 [Saprospiraceae bacterium]|nr:hypothetical protein [Saprospiraceae bacterium]
MTGKNFFESLYEKLTALRPSEAHREDDWAALEAQLNVVLPQKEKRRRPFLLPLILLAGLLLSNGIWWQVHDRELVHTQQVEKQINTLKNIVDSIEKTSVINRTDTVWRTIYIGNKMNDFIEKTNDLSQNTPKSSTNNNFLIAQKEHQTEPVSLETMSLKELNTAMTSLKSETNLVKNTRQSVSEILEIQTELKALTFEKTPIIQPFDNKPIIISEKNTPLFLKHPAVKIGLKADYLTPLSTSLTTHSGVGMGVQSSVRFTKHLSVVGTMGMARLNYTATNKDAILGSPEELPSGANQPNTSLQMHMKNQGCMHYDLSLRYTFNPISKINPFIGVGFASMILKPYQMDLQVQNNQTMVISQSSFQVTPKMSQHQMFHLSTGIEMPLSQRISFSFEGYFMRQWQKTVALSPDFMGIRTGVHYGF